MPLFNKEILYRYKTHPFPDLNIIAWVSFCTYIHTYLHSNAAVKKADDLKVTKWIHKLNNYQQTIRKGHVLPTWQKCIVGQSLSVLQCTVCVRECVCARVYRHISLITSFCVRFIRVCFTSPVCLIYVHVPRGTPVPQHGISFWPVGAYTGACCKPLMAEGQQVKRSVMTNTS